MRKNHILVNKHCTKSTFYAMSEPRGVTLIALIVTIIVLLILAGVTIANITGVDSTIDKAEQAKDENAIQAELEEIQSAIANASTKGIRHGNFSGSADVSSIRATLKSKNLIKENPDDVIIDEKSEWIVTGKKTGWCYTISSGGEVQLIKLVNDIKNSNNSNSPLSTSQNVIVQDDLGNYITIPAGFGIANDSGTKVEEGIVIEDMTSQSTSGSQFVWVPVGNSIKVSENVASRKTDGTIDIKLGRYSENNSVLVQDVSNGYIQTITTHGIKDGSNYYYEFAKKQPNDLGDSESVDILERETDNTKAVNIKDFVSSALNNKGYYIARFEAGVKDTENVDSNTDISYTINGLTFNKNTTPSNSLVIKKGLAVWNCITQPNAAILCQNMYSNNALITSDLINSYAWDTALKFIQICEDNSYLLNDGKSKTNTIGKTGENILEISNSLDKKCNIFDLLGNVKEWSTESFSGTSNPCVYRGGQYSGGAYRASFRTYYNVTYKYYHISFRPILYIK